MVNALVSLVFRVYFEVLWWILSYIFEVLLQVVSELFLGHEVGEFLGTKWKIFFSLFLHIFDGKKEDDSIQVDL
jgi:hypothetical protein